ncbi:hypothetical protein HA402_015896 [Bradysia odoriphaga]|nr:hypothetical protein HA402_015896 [Bradysia odoriphaga]
MLHYFAVISRFQYLQITGAPYLDELDYDAAVVHEMQLANILSEEASTGKCQCLDAEKVFYMFNRNFDRRKYERENTKETTKVRLNKRKKALEQEKIRRQQEDRGGMAGRGGGMAGSGGGMAGSGGGMAGSGGRMARSGGKMAGSGIRGVMAGIGSGISGSGRGMTGSGRGGKVTGSRGGEKSKTERVVDEQGYELVIKKRQRK